MAMGCASQPRPRWTAAPDGSASSPVRKPSNCSTSRSRSSWSIAPSPLLEHLVRAGVHVSVFDTQALDDVAAAAGRAGTPAQVHVKLDTGMGRLGVRPEDRAALFARLDELAPTIELRGVFTHFADSEAPDLTFTHEQHARFLQALADIGPRGEGALVHCSNSGAILRAPEMHHDLVRLGIGLYGYPPETTGNTLGLRPAMTMFAPVTQVKTVRAGDTVGYGRTWTAPVDTVIATVGAGYADGVFRAQSNTGTVLVHGRRCAVVGRVSMDQITVDVSGIAHLQPGDDVVLFGTADGVTLGADEVGAVVGTIPHEVMCAVPDRVPRIEVEG